MTAEKHIPQDIIDQWRNVRKEILKALGNKSKAKR
jgi:hypothetical protein